MSANIKHVAVKKLKTTKSGNVRFWEESTDLARTFKAGDSVNISYLEDSKIFLVQRADILGTHVIASRKNGRPIIDIKNKRITSLFAGVEKVEITYYDDKIVVKVARVEQLEHERLSKSGLNIFEVFCGGGTLTEHFKDAGFKSVGGLELVDKYLVNFEKNNKGEELYTISSAIEDLTHEHYPKNVDVVLAGIPCTSFSRASVKMQKALGKKNNDLDLDEEDKKMISQRFDAEALTFYVLEAIRSMNPRTVVVEEVVEYSKTSASDLLRTILGRMNYKISESVGTGSYSKRKRWSLVANMRETIDIDIESLLPPLEKRKRISDLLDGDIETRDWKRADEIARIKRAGETKSVGIRKAYPCDVLVNTFTSHSTRSTEPILAHPTKELYSEFSNNEIRKIHGLNDNFILPKEKTVARQILGQGTTDQFYYIARRIKKTHTGL